VAEACNVEWHEKKQRNAKALIATVTSLIVTLTQPNPTLPNTNSNPSPDPNSICNPTGCSRRRDPGPKQGLPKATPYASLSP
jgi:hypothetical protein